MTSDLLIVGAGYVGLRLAARARAMGWNVTATTRSDASAAALEEIGAKVLRWSAGDPLPVGANTDVVFSVPPTDGAPPAAIVDIANRCRRFVYLSSASVYGNYDGEVVDEDSDRHPTSPAGRARLAIEDALFTSGLDALIVRIVGIYGPDRTLDRYIANGRYKVVDGGEKTTNRIHVDDLVTVILAAIERAPRGPRAYIAADGNPVRVVDLVEWLVEHRGIEPPPQVTLEELRDQRGDNAAERWANSYHASNQRVRDELGVEFEHPDVIHGYRAIFG